MLNKIIKGIKNPKICAVLLLNKMHFLSDKTYLKIRYRIEMGKKLNLKNPETLNEKLNWLKIYDRNPEYCKLVDKYEVRSYIQEMLGEEYLIPCLGIWNSFEEIDFDKLPEQFVLKCTHDSGSVVICKDKSDFDIQKAKEKIERKMKKNLYWWAREWVYKDVKPRIIAEKYMVDESCTELKDYKIFCFNGEAKYVEVDFNRFIEHKLNTYDFDWNPLNFGDDSKNDYEANIQKPEKLDKMKEFAERLSSGKKMVRVDFYYINGDIYVGEITFYPGAGYIKFNPPEWDYKLGKMLDIGQNK